MGILAQKSDVRVRAIAGRSVCVPPSPCALVVASPFRRCSPSVWTWSARLRARRWTSPASALVRTGEEWAPIADAEPSGPFFGVLAAGVASQEHAERGGGNFGGFPTKSSRKTKTQCCGPWPFQVESWSRSARPSSQVSLERGARREAKPKTSKQNRKAHGVLCQRRGCVIRAAPCLFQC